MNFKNTTKQTLKEIKRNNTIETFELQRTVFPIQRDRYKLEIKKYRYDTMNVF